MFDKTYHTHYHFIDGTRQGVACTNEVHMECLHPELHVVPVENWYCAECCDDRYGVQVLEAQLLQVQHERNHFLASNPNATYQQWLHHRISHLGGFLKSVLAWVHPIDHTPPASELTTFLSSPSIIGKRVSISIDRKSYFARVLHARYNEVLHTYEHLVEFQSAQADLQKPFIAYIYLEEFPTILYQDLVLVRRYPGTPHVVGQRCFHSALSKILNPHNVIAPEDIQTKSLVYFLDDEVFAILGKSTMHLFLAHPHDLRLSKSKKNTISLALACIEYEEQCTVVRANRYMSEQQLATHGATSGGLKLHHLKSLASNPSILMGQCDIKQNYRGSSASHDISARLRGGRVVALDGLYMLANNQLLGSTSTSSRQVSSGGGEGQADQEAEEEEMLDLDEDYGNDGDEGEGGDQEAVIAQEPSAIDLDIEGEAMDEQLAPHQTQPSPEQTNPRFAFDKDIFDFEAVRLVRLPILQYCTILCLLVCVA
jgi:hypothetical protein